MTNPATDIAAARARAETIRRAPVSVESILGTAVFSLLALPNSGKSVAARHRPGARR